MGGGESKDDFYLRGMKNSKENDGMTVMEMPGIRRMITIIIVVITLRRAREAAEFVLCIERMVLWRDPCENSQQKCEPGTLERNQDYI